MQRQIGETISRVPAKSKYDTGGVCFASGSDAAGGIKMGAGNEYSRHHTAPQYLQTAERPCGRAAWHRGEDIER